jgi:aminodeoxychorismate lyase
MLCYVNGTFMEEKNALIPIQDRGFRYGDGIFETILVQQATPLHLARHLKRLQQGMQSLHIPTDTDNLHNLCRELIERNSVTDAILRIAISRGRGGRGYRPPMEARPSLIIECLPLPPDADSPPPGLRLMVSRYQKISPAALPVQHKMMQGLNSTLCAMEAESHGFDDAILLNHQGHICETSSANIFWLQQHQLFTPALSCGVLAGVTREIICESWPDGVKEGNYSIDRLQEAEAIFLTSAIKGVQGVAQLTTAQGTQHFSSAAIARQAMQLWQQANQHNITSQQCM